MAPTMESPRPEWEPSEFHGEGAAGMRRTASGRWVAAAECGDGDSVAPGGDQASDWGGWRLTRGGWCSASRDGNDEGSAEGAGRGWASGGGASGGYFGGLVSSVGVWLGFKSVALEVKS